VSVPDKFIDWALPFIGGTCAAAWGVDQVFTFRRSLKSDGSDPNRSIGMFLDTWTPTLTEKEMGTGLRQPVEGVYDIYVQNMIKTLGDEDQGRHTLSLDAAVILAILYRNPSLPLAFPKFEETFMGAVERVLKVDVVRQRYATRPGSTGSNFYAQTDVRLTTELTMLGGS
jgi:hypothetical protein